ncbi:alkylhydroperoxidase, partial [Mesorhizobium sp. M0684]
EATADDIAALRSVGMNDAEIIDLIHAISIFGWANRLMHVLGHAESG